MAVIHSEELQNVQESNPACVPQVDSNSSESMPSNQAMEVEHGTEESQTSTTIPEGNSNVMQQEEEGNAQRELEKLKLENEKQKQTIAALTGTEGITVDTNDLAVLYHLQLRETQRLQNEIERLHQMLSDVCHGKSDHL